MLDYDKLAAEYVRHRRIHPGVLREILTAGTITARSDVCEVGCGTGNYITEIQSTTGCRCCGVDPSEEMLSRARAQSQNVQWRKGTGEDLPVARGAIDLIFSVDVIHHISDRAAFRRTWKRRSRPCTSSPTPTFKGESRGWTTT
jgi:ubiquinone/menaquinone biosynthesis C-methylase UbiE